MTVLKRHLESSSELDRHVLSLCVDTWWAKLSTIPRRKRAPVLQPLKERGIANSILLRILQHEKHWQVVILNDFKLCDRLCFLAVSEGLDRHIKNWIGVDVHSEDENPSSMWRGSLLRSLCFAHTHCDIDGKSDSALECFFDVADRRSVAMETRQKGLPGTSLMSCSLFPAIIELERIIREPQVTTRTDPYERFRCILHTIANNTKDVALLHARLDLYHPEKPQETSMLELLRKQDTHGLDDGSILPVMSGMKSFGPTIQKTIAVTLSSGNTEGAEWVQSAYGHFIRHQGGFHRPV